MTNIRFMDEITAPRRSTIHPGQLRPHHRRRSLTSSHSEPAEPVPLAEFVAAMAVEVPQLHLYAGLARELTGWIEESRKICRQAEEDALKVTPALFTEFAYADEVEKQDLLVSGVQFLVLKSTEND
jgi:kinetochore protein Spc7/SPC105